MRLTLVMEMVVDKDVDVKVDEEVDVEVNCEVFEEEAKYVYNALKRNFPHKDQWMRMLVFAIFCQTEAAGGSQDHLVCLHPLTIIKDQSHMSKVLLTLGTEMHISGHS